MVHRALGVHATALLAAVVNASLTLSALIIDTATRCTLVLIAAVLTLGAAFVVSASRDAATVIGADLTDVAELIPTATLGALSLSADFALRTTSGLDATGLAGAVDADFA